MSANNENPESDLLIQEVDEDLRREQYIKLWRAYGKYAIAGALLIVLGVAGHQLWLSWRAQQFQKTAAAFASAEDLIGAGKNNEAEARLTEIAQGNQTGFAMVAAFRKAQMQTEGGDAAGAAATYDALAKSDAPSVFRDLAILKGALLTLDSADPEALQKKILPLAEAGNPWHFTATELLALLANRRGDKDGALSTYKKLADDAAAPQDIRARAVDMIAALGGGTAAAKPEKG